MTVLQPTAVRNIAARGSSAGWC